MPREPAVENGHTLAPVHERMNEKSTQARNEARRSHTGGGDVKAQFGQKTTPARLAFYRCAPDSIFCWMTVFSAASSNWASE